MTDANITTLQDNLRKMFDNIDADYAAQLQGNLKPEQLTIARIKRYSAAYTAYLAELAKLEASP
jgi:hypothetical protein